MQDVPKALSAEAVGSRGRVGFERKRVTELSDSRQDPGKSGRSAREDTQTLERTMVIHAIFLGVYTWI